MAMLAALTLSALLDHLQQDLPSVRDFGEHATRKVEQDYALRERDAAPLEEFRGGSSGGGDLGAGLALLGLLGLLAAGALAVLLYAGIAAIVKAAG
jgi:hypothetical protein